MRAWTTSATIAGMHLGIMGYEPQWIRELATIKSAHEERLAARIDVDEHGPEFRRIVLSHGGK